MRHRTVFSEKGIYAGWPANHGAWQWGDEFLVGFMIGRHYEFGGAHNVRLPFLKVQARSHDGGEHWTTETPLVDFEASSTKTPPAFVLGGGTIIRVCGRYDHGGEQCVNEGGFYLSHDRGLSWKGAYSFEGLHDTFKPPNHNTSRTSGFGKQVLLSAAARDHWGSDWIFIAEHNGLSFEQKATIVNDDARAVMPVMARLHNRLVVVARRLGTRRSGAWIDSFISDDEGVTWSTGHHVGETGVYNGNPPALVEVGGLLYCAFANRTAMSIDLMVSRDGQNWGGIATLRKGECSDIGYPQLFKRTDGQIVCVYYWADTDEQCQRIEATVFDPREHV